MLKRALGDLVPPGFAARPRPPQPLPLDTWMAGPLGARLADRLSRSGMVRSGVLDADTVRTLVARHRTEGGRAESLWAVGVLVDWADAHGFESVAAHDRKPEGQLVHSRS
jgi:hypothetical protein